MKLVEAAALEAGLREEAAARGGDAEACEDLLRHRLVERDAQAVRVAAGVGEAQLLEEGRVEAAAHLAASPLGGVEHDVRQERLEARDQARGGPGHVDGLDVVAGLLERARDGGDGLGGVELRFLFRVVDPQVVRQGDAHWTHG